MTTSPRLLVVDDSKVSRIMSIGFIRRQRPDIEIQEAGNAEEALAKISSMPIDWVLLDHNMPGQTGLDFAEAVLGRFPKLRIALMTANIQDATQNRAAALGVHFFKKPVGDAVISQALAALSAEPAKASA